MGCTLARKTRSVKHLVECVQNLDVFNGKSKVELNFQNANVMVLIWAQNKSNPAALVSFLTGKFNKIKAKMSPSLQIFVTPRVDATSELLCPLT